MMKTGVLIVIMLLLVNVIQAQFGITGRYHFNDAPKWVPFVDRNSAQSFQYLGDSWSVGIDYWLRLKNYRVEFLPEFNYASFENTLVRTANDVTFKNNFYSFFFNTNFYPFDFFGDCNCPTFSKQGQFLKKGFFLQLSPGITRMDNSLAYATEPIPDYGTNFQATDWAFSVGGAVGIDIGLSDFMTLSPMAGVRYFPNAAWSSFSNYVVDDLYSPLSAKSAIWQWSAGARLGFRFDYQSSGRRR